MDNKTIIKIIGEAYKYHKNYVEEVDYLLIDKSFSKIAISQKICAHIEFVIYGLDDKYSIILQNDIIKGLMDKKYKECCSKSTYYRNRDKAYEMFIRELNR